jgi:hypothetical protein
LLGLGGMYFLEKSKEFDFKMVIALNFILLALILRVDYSWYGVALIFVFYYFRKNLQAKFISAEVLSILASFKIIAFQFFAFIGFVPIALYNGKRGLKIGHIYYSFYAVHLLVLFLIKQDLLTKNILMKMFLKIP